MRLIDESWKRHEIDLPEQDDIKEYLTPPKIFSYRESFVRFVMLVRIVKERPNANREVQKILLDEIKNTSCVQITKAAEVLARARIT